MFKKSLFATILVLLIASSGFADNLKLNKKDAERSMKLDSNVAAILELEANPSTGYIWHAVSSDKKIIKVVGSKFSTKHSNLIGSSGIRTFHIKNVGRGKADLVLTLKRTYRKESSSKEPLEKLTFHFESIDTFKGTFPALENSNKVVGGGKGGNNKTERPPKSSLPLYYNACDENGCSPVKDQENCGSCWAFATVGVLENAIIKAHGPVEDLSEQYLVSCNAEGWSCETGGWWAHDYHWWKAIGGYTPGAKFESDFAYVGIDAPCNATSNSDTYKITNWEYVDSRRSLPSTEKIKQAIYDHGSVTAAVCVNNAFVDYQGGIFDGPSCRGINHAIVLVGWDDVGGYWILRNSWGPDWGENGYMRIKYKVCAVGSYATWINY